MDIRERVTDHLGVRQVTIGLTDFGGHHHDVLHDLTTSLASDDVEVSS